MCTRKGGDYLFTHIVTVLIRSLPIFALEYSLHVSANSALKIC